MNRPALKAYIEVSMQFDPAIHTKEFLLSNPKVAYELAEKSSEFATNELASDFLILSLDLGGGWTIAHRLAAYQKAWRKSAAANSNEVMRLANDYGSTVAHQLARWQSEWLHSEASKSYDIMSLSDNDGWTVAHFLVLRDKQCIYHQNIMQKQILTLQNEGKMLAEFIAEKYKSDGMDVPVMAMKLIEQGAAYKHSVPMNVEIGESLLRECKLIIDDSREPLVTFKQLQAAHSTFAHNVAKIISTQEQESLHKWQGLLLQSENMIRQHLNKNPEIYDMEHTVDIFCEPGDDLLKKLQSERILASDLTSLSGLNHTNTSEQEPKIQSLY
jgi:hypothetical protein